MICSGFDAYHLLTFNMEIKNDDDNLCEYIWLTKIDSDLKMREYLRCTIVT